MIEAILLEVEKLAIEDGPALLAGIEAIFQRKSREREMQAAVVAANTAADALEDVVAPKKP